MSTISVEDQVSETYHDNIAYFQEHHPALLEKISSFEAALEHGHYEEKYTLEYKDEGYFDVKELSTQEYLYGQDSLAYAKKCVEGIDYAKKGSLFETFYNFDFTDQDIETYKDLGIETNGASGIAPIIHYTHKIVDKDMHLKKIEKFTFFGVGLGTHLVTVDAEIEAKVYLIVEDDLELFRLSMFVTNYKKLAQNSTLFFSVFEEVESAKVIFISFLEKNFFDNHYIKYFQMLNFDDANVNVFHSVIASLDYMVYPYHSYCSQYLRPLEYMKENYKFLDVSGNNPLDEFDKRPVLVLASGPSLKKNIQWLKDNQEKFIIITLTSALSTLEKGSISPDIVVHLDPFEEDSLLLIKKLKSLEFLHDSLFLFAAKTPMKLTEMFDKEKVFMYEESTNYIESFGVAKSSCVGSTAHALSLILGAKETYLLGLDLALDEETGSTHSPDHAFNKSLDMSGVDKVNDVFSYLDSVIKVKGNFQDEVLTTAPFYNSIIGINRNAMVYKKSHQMVYNLNDGARLHEAVPMKLSAVDVERLKKIDKSHLHIKLIEALDKNSMDSFNDDNLLNPIKKRLEHTKQVKDILKTYQKHITYTSVDNYRRELSVLVSNLLDTRMEESLSLVVIYYKYLQYVLPYVYDMLNTKELSNPKRHMKKIDKILFSKLMQIEEHYESVIESFVSEALVY